MFNIIVIIVFILRDTTVTAESTNEELTKLKLSLEFIAQKQHVTSLS